MSISRDDVVHVARLARLEVPEDELEHVREELAGIVDAVSKVRELDLTAVEATSHPLDVVNQSREDVPRPSLPRERALANAPDPAEGQFRVPAVG